MDWDRVLDVVRHFPRHTAFISTLTMDFCHVCVCDRPDLTALVDWCVCVCVFVCVWCVSVSVRLFVQNVFVTSA